MFIVGMANVIPQGLGARDAMALCDSISGWLRRQGKLERVLTRVLALLKIKYETSTAPLQVSSLADYNAVMRAALETGPVAMVPWCFKLDPDSSAKPHYFACTSQTDMEKWMGQLKRELMKAHKVPIKSTDKFDAGDYTFLEAPISPKSATQQATSTLFRGPSASADDSSSSADEYFEIDEAEMRKGKGAKNMPLPPIPKGDSGRVNNAAPKNNKLHYINVPNKKPVVSRKPGGDKQKTEREISSRPSDFMFDSSDKEAAARLLGKNKGTGVFLVRKSRRSENQEVLAVKTPNGVKEYQIFDEGNKKTLDRSLQFDTIEDLLKFYRSHQLPTQPFKLSHGYSSTDLSSP